MRTSLVQFHASLGDVDENLERMNAIIKGTDTDLVVFPEMALTGYANKDTLFNLAEYIDGPSIKKLSATASSENRSILFGMPLRSTTEGYIHNSAVLIRPDKDPIAYSKHQLAVFGPFDDSQFFTKGRDLIIAEVCGFRIGLLICFDLFFPELAKFYTMKGADAIIAISASPSATKPFFEMVLPSRAVENTIYMLYTNLVGTEANLVFWGGAQAYSPKGFLMDKGSEYEEQVVDIELKTSTLGSSRQFRPTIARTDKIYGKNLDSSFTLGDGRTDYLSR